MKFLEAIELLGKVHRNDDNFYIDDIAEKVGNGEYTIAMKRKSNDRIAVLRQFYGDGDEIVGMFDYDECRFCLISNEHTALAFPFECGDFTATDWVCWIIDCDGNLKGELYKTFNQFLLDEHGDTLLDYDSAVEKLNKFFGKYTKAEIKRIDFESIYKDDTSTLMNTSNQISLANALSCLAEFSKDDLFEIEVTLNGDEPDINLAEWEDE